MRCCLICNSGCSRRCRAAIGSLVWSGADREGGDAPVGRELEMEPQADGAPREVPGDVDGRVVAGGCGLDVAEGVGDAGDLAAPCADGGDAVMRLALVLDDCARGELGEVGVSVGPRREVKVAVDEFLGVAHGFLPPGGTVRWWGGCRRR